MIKAFPSEMFFLCQHTVHYYILLKIFRKKLQKSLDIEMPFVYNIKDVDTWVEAEGYFKRH
ncbi:MAG TPA: hypothetical protein DCO89_02860 [Clostridiales bacterium]|nr:hypothetical protein [Clostridiales bacterium]